MTTRAEYDAKLDEADAIIDWLRQVESIDSGEPPPEGNVINVGPGMQFEEPHLVPWRTIVPKTTVKIHWRLNRYRSKIAVNVPCNIVGVAGPNGELPAIDAREAFENKDAAFYTDQVNKAGIFSVIPPGPGPSVDGVLIDGFLLQGARRENEFTDRNGNKQTYWNGCAGVSMYKTSNVTIRNCDISDCENGIFGTTSQNVPIRNTIIEKNRIGGCGRYVIPKDRTHNCYVEGIGTVIRFNTFDKPVAGSAGCNLKDRGAGTMIVCNVFEGGSVIIDLVDPEAGSEGGVFQAERLCGINFLLGNIIANPMNGGAGAGMVAMGFDGEPKHGQKQLYALWNTIVNKNVQNGGRYRTYIFKSREGFDGPTLQRRAFNLGNNIIYHYSPTTGSPGECFMMTESDGWAGADVVLKNNWIGSNIGQWYYQALTDPKKPDFVGWPERYTGVDPGMVSPVDWDFSLKADSVCRGKAADMATLGWPTLPPSHSWTPEGWIARTSFENLGASE